jgi:hypothetical protein
LSIDETEGIPAAAGSYDCSQILHLPNTLEVQDEYQRVLFIGMKTHFPLHRDQMCGNSEAQRRTACLSYTQDFGFEFTRYYAASLAACDHNSPLDKLLLEANFIRCVCLVRPLAQSESLCLFQPLQTPHSHSIHHHLKMVFQRFLTQSGRLSTVNNNKIRLRSSWQPSKPRGQNFVT